MPRPILEVIALSAADARAAQAGGADRLELVTDMDSAGLTPSVRTFTEVSSAVDIPVRVMLRDAPGFAPGDLSALAGAARALHRAGAREFVLGFLTASGEVDLPAVHTVLNALDGAPWTFHRAIDHARDRTSAWSAITGLPGLDQVLTAGSPTGVPAGLPTLAAEATAGHAPRILAGGALQKPHTAPLTTAGVRAFHTGSGVRPAGSWSTPVSPDLVHTWRTHLDNPAPPAG